MLNKSRLTIATVVATVALGAPPALAMPIAESGADARQLDMHASTVVPADGTSDARGEHAASLSDAPATQQYRGTSDARGEHAASLADGPTTVDLRSPDAREPFLRAVVVEVGDPVAPSFDWTSAIIGLAGGLALAVLAGTAVAGARRRQVRPSVG